MKFSFVFKLTILVTIGIITLTDAHGASSSHERPSFNKMLNGWMTQLSRRATSMKTHFRATKDNTGIMMMNKLTQTGDKVSKVVGDIYSGGVVAVETGRDIAYGTGTIIKLGADMAGSTIVNAGTAALDNIADSSNICLDDSVYSEHSRVIKGLFIHGIVDENGNSLIKTIPLKIMNNELPGISRKSVDIIRKNGTYPCDAWEIYPSVIRTLLLKYKSVPNYDSPEDLANAYEKAWKASIDVNEHRIDDCKTEFVYC